MKLRFLIYILGILSFLAVGPATGLAQSGISGLNFDYPRVFESTRAPSRFNPLRSSRVQRNNFERPRLAFLRAQARYQSDLAWGEHRQSVARQKRADRRRATRLKEKQRELRKRERRARVRRKEEAEAREEADRSEKQEARKRARLAEQGEQEEEATIEPQNKKRLKGEKLKSKAKKKEISQKRSGSKANKEKVGKKTRKTQNKSEEKEKSLLARFREILFR